MLIAFCVWIALQLPMALLLARIVHQHDEAAS